MKKLCIITGGLLITGLGISQSITQATIGSMGGQFKNGNITLSFTLGETIIGLQTNAQVQLGSGFWTIVPTSYTPAAVIVYRFIGDGSFFTAANWQGGQVPPNPLPVGREILIEPVGTGECILNAPYSISPGSKFSVVSGKRLIIAGNLIINKP